MFFFDKHKPEDLNESCVNLGEYDEYFRILRHFSDKIIIADVNGSKSFLKIFD